MTVAEAHAAGSATPMSAGAVPREYNFAADWPTAFLGCLKAGIIAVPVNTLLTEDDFGFMLADSRAKCLVVSEALFPKFEKLIKQSPDLEHVIVSGANSHGHQPFEDLVGASKPE